MILLIQRKAHSNISEKRGLTSRTTDRGLASPDLGLFVLGTLTVAWGRCGREVFHVLIEASRSFLPVSQQSY